ncbi:MAG: DNA polymerase domain-containing protein [Candidatus Caldarchaeum sp.]|nr:DNA polymerase domain-containing protein [Candidatus Caldarchaeum sp.]
MEGQLLDVRLDECGVCLWLRREKDVVKMSVGWRSRLYLAGPQHVLQSVEKTLADVYEVRFVEKRILGVGLAEVLEVLAPPAEKRRLADVVEERWSHLGVRAYNVDIPLLQEFLYEYKLAPTALVRISNGRPEPGEEVDTTLYSTSFLRVARLEAEVCSAGPLPRFSDRLRRLRINLDGEEVVLEGCEETVLQQLQSILDDLNVDVLITRGGDDFLIKYLRERAEANSLQLRLGREKDYATRSRGFSYFSYGRVYHRFGGQRLNGRLHIDAENSMLYAETGLDGVLETARTVRVPVQDAARYTIGRCMTSLQYRQAYLNNVLIPVEGGKPYHSTAAELVVADRGGWVLDHRPGLYWNVGELDFHSLYPTLMLKHNVSGETVNCGCCAGGDIPELGYPVCRRWRGIVPLAIETPLRKRMEYKRLYRETGLKAYKARADALKWILVTSFGYLGYRKAKFGSREAHMAVCALARETLLKAVDTAEKHGFKVLHGIVDCLWVWRDNASEEDYRELKEKLEKKLGLPLENEGTYRWIVFLPSRTHAERPVNNRYFGIYVDGRLKYRGIELRRRDTPLIVKQMQKEILEKLAEADSPDRLRLKTAECLETYRRYLRMIRSGDVEAESLALVRGVSASLESYRKKLRHVLAAKMLEQHGWTTQPGQSVEYVVKRGGGVPLQLVRDGGYDEEYYAELLRRSMETLLQPFITRFQTRRPEP